jgi:outer membrane protein TolC
MLRASGRIGHGFGPWLGSLAILSFLGAVDRARAASEELSEIFVEVRPSAIETRTTPTREIAFVEVLELALDQNLDLKLARAEEEIRRARSQGATSKLVPALEFGAGTAHTDGRVQGSFGLLADTEFDTKVATASVTYQVNVGARILDALAARKELDAAVYGVLNTRQRLLLRVAELYGNLGLARVGYQIAQQRTQDSEEFLRIASARERAGVGLGSDAALARVELATDRQALILAREIWETASVRLAVVLHLDSFVFLIPAENRLTPIDFEAAMRGHEAEQSARQRPDVEASRRRMEAAARRFTAAWWDLAGPELNAELRETYIGDRVDDTGDRRNAGLFLGWTLSLEKAAKLGERRAERKAAHLEALREEERAAGEARRALVEMEAARDRVPLAWDGLEAAQQNHRINLAQFKSGTAIALEVLHASHRLAGAQLDLARSIIDYNLSQVKLLAATGVLQLDLLQRPHQGGS